MEGSRLVFFIALTSGSAYAYLLNNDVTVAPHVPRLPQFEQFGRSMVLVGGGLSDNNTEVYEKIIELAGGKNKAKIGIITAASADPLDAFTFYHDLFLKYGALEANRIILDVNHTANQGGQALIESIYAQSGFFFGGGDQARIIKAFMGPYGDFSPALIALHQMYDSGAVIAGTSAGCSCQTANFMIMGGYSYDALRYGSFADVDPALPGRAEPNIYLTFGGLGFLKGYLLDSHFAQRGREGRLIRFVADTRMLGKGTNRAIGVDENTALVVTHADDTRSSGQVIGTAGVTIFDLTHAQVHSSKHFDISDVYVTYLTHGDVIQMTDQSVTFSPSKSPMRGHENYDDVLTTNDVFYGTSDGSRKPEFVRIATSVFDARRGRMTHGFSKESGPRFRVDMSAVGNDAVGYVERKNSFHSDITSYKNLKVSIYEG
ncbi:cyanophycinase-like [Dreissena polymorpha]|uniref:Cyanophycinase n=1 Tax=Dreissena polymorpha TaxID=45954 RepID=A0A9D4IW61_DREPO|nr:cyanophycinase-like [Dreissena polymorpha]XP_052226749.1 cyanophycinase-like [Dreissena polymorpha]KAH3786892.1 hypothetical protein DPMN_165007 [Dreissena polymorpha]